MLDSSGENAEVTIKANILGMLSMLINRTNMQATIYKTNIKGTSFDVTAPILLIPPMITAPTTIAKISPVTIVGTPKYDCVKFATFQA